MTLGDILFFFRTVFNSDNDILLFIKSDKLYSIFRKFFLLNKIKVFFKGFSLNETVEINILFFKKYFN